MKRAAGTSRGFVLADAIIGLFIVSMVATVLAVAVSSEHSAAQRLADLRAANRTADRVLLNLEHHQMPPVISHARVEIRYNKERAPSGYVWATVEATVRGRRASLVGIVPSPEGL